jgi:hypothetical protein
VATATVTVTKGKSQRIIISTGWLFPHSKKVVWHSLSSKKLVRDALSSHTMQEKMRQSGGLKCAKRSGTREMGKTTATAV